MTQIEVIEKVKKLLALANNAGASEGERDNAMRMATKLLARFNLSIADVESSLSDREKRDLDLDPKRSGWAHTVYNGLANLFYCVYYKNGDDKGVMVGKTVNTTTASLMADYVIESIAKEAVARAGLSKLDSLFGVQSTENGKGKDWAQDFCLGASIAVFNKCVELRKREETLNEAEKIQGTGTSMTLAGYWDQERAKNLDLLKKMGVNLRDSAQVKIKNESALDAGKRHGQSISLNRQVGAGPQNLRLGVK